MSRAAASGMALFPTAVGRCGIAWGAGGVTGVKLPEQDDAATRARLVERAGDLPQGDPPASVKRAIKAITRLLAGEPDAHRALQSIELALSGVPPFHARIYEALRRIEPGRTVGYGELAALAGSPRAARAVGQAMARNPFPVVVPCHRVVGSTGAPVGFSSHGGVTTKARLLAIEGVKGKPAQTSLFDGDHAQSARAER